MGNSTSASITNTIENKNITKSTIEAINKNTSRIITTTIVSNQSSSKSSTTQVGDIEIGNITASGKDSDISGLEILIDQNSNITFTSNDQSIQDNNIMVDYALKLVAQLQNSISNDQAAKLASDAQASQSNGFLSTAMGNSVKSDANNNIKNINENINMSKILNQVTNTIEQNSTTLNFKECILSNLQSGRFKIGEITAQNGGKIQNVTLGVKQSMVLIENCIFNTLQKSDITTKIAQDFGFTVTNDTKNKQTGDSTAASAAIQKNEGVTGLSMYSIIASVVVSVIGIIVSAIVLLMRTKGINKMQYAAADTISKSGSAAAEGIKQGMGNLTSQVTQTVGAQTSQISQNVGAKANKAGKKAGKFNFKKR